MNILKPLGALLLLGLTVLAAMAVGAGITTLLVDLFRELMK